MLEGFRVKGPEKLKCPSHINSELEVVYVKEGSLEINYGKESVIIESRQASIVFPYCLHEFLPSEEVEAYVLMFPYEIYHNLYTQYRNKLPSKYMFSFSPEAVVYIDSLVRRRNELSEYEIKSLFYVCIGAFFKQDNYWNEVNTGLLKRIMEIVSQGEVDNVTIKSVSEQLEVSEELLTSYLRNQARVKFRDLVNGILLSKALNLLENERLNITQVAIKSGFGSLRTFNRIFIDSMGCTPTQYRKGRKKIFVLS